jgi:predicted TIM-barrel fold metal-dependent hydrolase
MMIDVHTHIFPTVNGMNGGGATRDAGYGRITIGDKRQQLLPPLCEQTRHTPEMLIASLDWAGVDRAVLLQGPFYGECNRYVLDALARYPDRLTGAAYVDPWDPWDQGGHDQFDQCMESGLFKVVKLEFSDGSGYLGFHPGAKLDGAGVAWLWPELEQRGLTLTLDLGAPGDRSYQTAAVRKIAQQHPGLKIVIAHLAQPRANVERDPELWRLWLEQLDLGRLPNVSFDTAALPAYYEAEGYPYPGAARMIRLAIERIGPARVMWGTDAPGLLSVATYKQLVTAGRQHVQFLSPDEQAMVLGGNAQLVYGAGAA